MERAAFEMDALPSFMSRLDQETSQTVIVGLIPNYFGRTIDQTQNDKIGDLMKDQLTVGIELIKASAEMVKNAKSLGDSTARVKMLRPNDTSPKDKSKPDGVA